MSLKGRKFASKELLLSDGEPVTIRGLSLSNISEIVLANREEAVRIFSTIMEKKDNLSVSDVASLADSMLLMAPNFSATVIAAGTGDISAFQEALEMPVGDQLNCLMEIGELTFKTSGGSKNVLEIVVKMLSGANVSLENLAPKTS